MGLLQETFRQETVLDVLGKISLNSEAGPIPFRKIEEKLKADMDARRRNAADVNPGHPLSALVKCYRRLNLEFAKYTIPQTPGELGETLKGLQDRCLVVQSNRDKGVEFKETTWIFGGRTYPAMPCNTAE